MADSVMEGPAVSSDGHYMAPQARAMGTTCLAAQCEGQVVNVPQSVLDMIVEARACEKRVGDLHVVSTDMTCMEFGRNDCIVRLTPRHGYVPKVFSTPFGAQVITLPVLLRRPRLHHIFYALFVLCVHKWTVLVILDCQSSFLSVSEIAILKMRCVPLGFVLTLLGVCLFCGLRIKGC